MQAYTIILVGLKTPHSGAIMTFYEGKIMLE